MTNPYRLTPRNPLVEDMARIEAEIYRLLPPRAPVVIVMSTYGRGPSRFYDTWMNHATLVPDPAPDWTSPDQYPPVLCEIRRKPCPGHRFVAGDPNRCFNCDRRSGHDGEIVEVKCCSCGRWIDTTSHGKKPKLTETWFCGSCDAY